MTDTTLATVTADPRLGPTARVLYAHLWAITDPEEGWGEILLRDLLDRLALSEPGVLRRHRQALRSLGYLDTTVDDHILRWSFPGASKPRACDDVPARLSRAPDAPSASKPRADDPDSARKSRAQDEESARFSRAEDAVTKLQTPSARDFRAPDPALVSQSVPIPTTHKNGTDRPVPGPAAEIDATYRLLTDPAVGISDSLARAIAKQHAFDYVLRQVFTWRHQLAAGKVKNAGALVARINSAYRAEDLTDADRTSDLYRRHVDHNAELVKRFSEPPRLGPSNAELLSRYGSNT